MTRKYLERENDGYTVETATVPEEGLRILGDRPPDCLVSDYNAVGEMDDGFCVADTGPGIPAAEREQVFEREYSTGEDGTGFGPRIVEQVGGARGWDVTAASSAEGGARTDITGVGFDTRPGA